MRKINMPNKHMDMWDQTPKHVERESPPQAGEILAMDQGLGK